MDKRKNRIMSCLIQTEINSIYHMQKRIYWEADSVNRCIDRRLEEVRLCDLPYRTLADEKMVLDMAYGLYCKMEDCNTAYSDTLDAIVDEVERCIARGYTGLWMRGDTMQSQICFKGIDIIEFMGRVVQRHMRHYQSDFRIDETALRRMAGCDEQQDRTFIWMCRTLGTWLLPERDVLLKGTGGNNIFTYYIEQTDDPVLVFAIKVMGLKDGLIIGDIYPLDYPAYYDHVCSVMLKAEIVILQYERGTRIKRADDMITSHPDAEYGRCLSIRYQPRHQEDLDRLLQREWGELECSREGDADTYIEGLSDPVSCTTRKGLSIKQGRR